MPTKFSYFPAYGKGLPILLSLVEHGVEFEGNPVGMSKWPELKATGAFPFGQLPVLETEDAGVIGQSTACLHYIAKTKNAGGKDLTETVKNDMLVGTSEDIFVDITKVQPTLMRKEFDKAAVDKLWAETIPSRLAYVEKLIDGKDRFTEAGNATGEMHLFSTLHQAKLAKDDVLEKTPNLLSFYKRVHDLPSVQTVLTGKSPFGEIAQSILKAE
eukprot:TRINITY_DN1937_c0_g1_i2.p1 TRINITY_DN1937_c0_g1~~TRINITY_DN1937_c0_g1_i2.p1  ORF type:complete len:236 (+),score=101.37 TRINITY_DN1937_c0_g1_i2:67-708(+)